MAAAGNAGPAPGPSARTMRGHAGATAARRYVRDGDGPSNGHHASLDMHGGSGAGRSPGGCSCAGSDGFPARGSAADSASPNEAPRAASRQRHGSVTGAPRAAFEVSGCLGEDLLGARLHTSSVTRQGMDHPGAAVAGGRVPAGEPAPGCLDAASGRCVGERPVPAASRSLAADACCLGRPRAHRPAAPRRLGRARLTT